MLAADLRLGVFVRGYSARLTLLSNASLHPHDSWSFWSWISPKSPRFIA